MVRSIECTYFNQRTFRFHKRSCLVASQPAGPVVVLSTAELAPEWTINVEPFEHLIGGSKPALIARIYIYIYIYVCVCVFVYKYCVSHWPPLWSSGQSSCPLTQRSRVRFPAPPDFQSSSRSGTGSTQPL
jgi:hypothetical protein